jgi:hypothetical protein
MTGIFEAKIILFIEKGLAGFSSVRIATMMGLDLWLRCELILNRFQQTVVA